MDYGWDFILQFIYLALVFFIGLLIKTRFKLFAKHLIPLSIIAGFIGLLLGPEVLKVIPFDGDVLAKFVYHAMSIGFIAIGLKDRRSKKNTVIVKTGLFIVNTYAFQAIIGISISLILAATVFPDLFPITGMLLPLGFAQGPGQAVGTGTAWQQYGFTNGGNVGLSIATFGFLWALVGGIPLMNILVKRRTGKKMRDIRPNPDDMVIPNVDIDDRSINVPHGLYMDELAVQIILIGVVYAATYGLMTALSALLAPLGTFGQTLSSLLWGFSFLWGSVLAILTRAILNFLLKKNIVKPKYVDNYLMQRISSSVFDFMIVAAISAVSIAVLKDYFVPIILITTIGGLATMLYVVVLSKWVYKEHVLEYIVMLYGTWTGTITTGMALLRELDPKGKTPVPENYVLGSALGAAFGFVLMLILNIPVQAVVTGDKTYYIWTYVALISYSIAMIVGIWLVKRKEDKTK